MLTLAGDKLAVNDLSSPERCAPRETTLAFQAGNGLSFELPPLSLTVLRVPAGR